MNEVEFNDDIDRDRAIEIAEREIIREKPWQLRGEVQARARPKNSLLDQTVQFEYATRPEPEITEEITKSIEDVIKQRIKDSAFDDVVRKTKNKKTAKYQRRLEVSHEKSKVGLGDLYAQEFQRLKSGETNEGDNPEVEDIKKRTKKLFDKLDVLFLYKD